MSATRKFLVAYSFTDGAGSGSGNVFATVPPFSGGLTEEAVLAWQEMIRDSRGAESVTIMYVTEVEG